MKKGRVSRLFSSRKGTWGKQTSNTTAVAGYLDFFFNPKYIDKGQAVERLTDVTKGSDRMQKNCKEMQKLNRRNLQGIAKEQC